MRPLRAVAARVVAQGRIIVNDAVVPPGRSFTVYLDCKSKYSGCLSWGSDFDGVPFVMLQATERTLKQDEQAEPEACTLVAFPEYRHMQIQAVDCGRYNVKICFLDERTWLHRVRDFFKR